MPIAPIQGYKGFAKVAGTQIPFLSWDYANPENNLIPPLVQGNQWPAVWAPGLQIPTVTITTHPMQHWWTQVAFGNFFFRGSGETVSTATIVTDDGAVTYEVLGAKGASLNLTAVQGGLVDVSLTFMGVSGTNITKGTAAAQVQTTPAIWSGVTLGTSTGVARVALAFSNSLGPDVSFSTGRAPNAIDEHAQVASLEITQKASGVAATTSETLRILAGTAPVLFTLGMLDAGPVRRCTWDETLIVRTYSVFGTAPFTVTYV